MEKLHNCAKGPTAHRKTVAVEGIAMQQFWQRALQTSRPSVTGRRWGMQKVRLQAVAEMVIASAWYMEGCHTLHSCWNYCQKILNSQHYILYYLQSNIVTIWFGCIKITCKLYVSWHFCDCILETNRTDHPTCITTKLCRRCHACYQCQAYFYHWEAVLWAHCLEQHWKVEECTTTTQAWSIPHSSSWTKCQISCCRCSFGHNATSESYALCLSSMASTGKAHRFLMFFSALSGSFKTYT